MKDLKQFTNLYQVAKTLRFELEPIGRTKENIERNGILKRDKQRATSYKTIKKVIDEYHKAFIESMLDNFELNLVDNGNLDSLEEYFFLYHLPSSDPTRNERLTKVQESLRQKISEQFVNSDQYKRLFGKELIREDLVPFIMTFRYENYIRSQKGNENLGDDEVHQIQEEVIHEIALFQKFVTYFVGFNDNRKNLYVADDKTTSIANRMIMENLPKFIDNMDVFERYASTNEVASHFDTLYKEMEAYLNVKSISEMFRLDYFSMVLTQKQIDVYNAIIGELNKMANLYNQQQTTKANKLPKLKPLFKQILSDRNAISWLPDEFRSDQEMLDSIEKCYQELRVQVFEGKDSLKEVLKRIGEYDLEHIFLPNDLQLTNIAKKHYGDWAVIKTAFEDTVRVENPQRRNEANETYETRIKKLLKAKNSYSLAQINSLISDHQGEEFKPIESYFAAMGAIDNEDSQKPNLFIRIENAYTEAKQLLTTAYPEDRKLSQDKANVEKVRNLLDAIKELQHFVKPLLGNGTESEKDNRFYGEFTPLWETLDQITPLYNMVRNRMTKKPYSDEKIKLYFDNGLFLNGWVDSKTESDKATQYGGYLFRKPNCISEYDYYLGVSAATKLFRSFNPVEKSDKSDFERLDYYQLKGNTFYGSLYKGDYVAESANVIHAIDSVVFHAGSASLKEKVNAERQKKHPKISTAIGYMRFIEQQDCNLYSILLQDESFEKSNQTIMSSMKATLLSLDRIPSAKEYAQRSHTLFSEMMDDIDVLLQEKVFSYFPISQSELEEATSRTAKPLYLFKITNKDLSFAETYAKGLRKARGTDNLHTMYFKALMSGTQNVFDIGSGSVFFRERKIVYTEEQLARGHHYDQLKEKFDYPIVSNKRYAFDKFQFHLSVVMNYNASKSNNINPLVNAYLKESNATHIIGIDRGERHLLYLSLIDLKGNIVEQYSLNEIVNEYKGHIHRTDYHELLSIKENQRDEARRSWQSIENIKELKEGYMSQAIHIIADMMVKNNAIIVLEDLNPGFIRGRQKREIQVYQKFEKMLIDKLNYLVSKKCKVDEIGGVLKAYQLTNTEKKFSEQYAKNKNTLGKQCGFLYFVPAWNTSKMDPTTGFVNLLDTRYENMAKAKVFFGKFRRIRYNAIKGWFEFSFDYDDFTNKAIGTKTQWTLCTYGTRIETKRDPIQNNKFVSEEFDLTSKFKELFAQYSIDLNSNLMEQICSQNDATFFKKLLYLLQMTLQIRNSMTGTDVDYLISPVMNNSGEFYDSRKCSENLPKNADANGAYNIARKGLWIIEQIKQSRDLSKLKLSISNREWLQYAQGLANQT